MVQELLGHSDIKMTMRYVHVAPDSLHEAVKVLPMLDILGSHAFGQQVGNKLPVPTIGAPVLGDCKAVISANL
jgi:hypothetical protein